MFFITLVKWKQAPTEDQVAQGTKWMEDIEKQGIKIQSFWTLGRYDAITIIEAPTEKDAMKMMIPWQDTIITETLTAVPRAEAIKLL
jgi:uncharacterized protein with GYD domain